MKLIRLTPLTIAFALALTGCRTGGLGNLGQPAPLAKKRPTAEVSEVITAYNRRAELVQSLEAKPSIKADIEGRSYALRGHLALERPRNFKLDVYHMTSSVADIGSNEDEFWFWVAPKAPKAEKAIFYCGYDDAKRSTLPPTFQPDWIMEAMGLRIIPEDEIAGFTLKRGTDPDALVLTHPPDQDQGFTRVTVLSESNHRIKEHRIYSADQTTLLGRAEVIDYRDFKVLPEDGGAEEVVSVPSKLKLEWVKEQLVLDITMGTETRVNLTFTDKQRAARFVEPELGKGYARVNLADQAGVAKAAPTTVRETRPAPPSRVRLEEPTPVEPEGARKPPRDPVVLSADLPSLPKVDDELVGPPLPSSPEPDFLKPGSSNWRNAAPAGYER